MKTPSVHADLLVPEIDYLRGYARALTRNASAADDLVQNALLRAVANISSFQPGTCLRAWLAAILHNCFIDDTRHARRMRIGEATAEIRMEGAYTRPNQVAHLELADLQAALGILNKEQRATIILVALEGMSYDEAAKALGVPRGTIRSRMSRARHVMMAEVEGMAIGDLSPEMTVVRRKKASTTAPMVSRGAPTASAPAMVCRHFS